jgi:hypothetical protein
MFFACKVGDKQYELPKLTLGEARILKKHFGLMQLEDMNPTDPDHLTGLLYLCLRREAPGATLEALLSRIDELDIEDFAMAESAPEEVPTVAADAAGGNGKKATSRKKTGSQS